MVIAIGGTVYTIKCNWHSYYFNLQPEPLLLGLWPVDESKVQKVNGTFDFLISLAKGTQKKCMLLLIARCKCILEKHRSTVLKLPIGVTVKEISSSETDDDIQNYAVNRRNKLEGAFSTEIEDATVESTVRGHVMSTYLNVSIKMDYFLKLQEFLFSNYTFKLKFHNDETFPKICEYQFIIICITCDGMFIRT